jgi:hypothetical protein
MKLTAADPAVLATDGGRTSALRASPRPWTALGGAADRRFGAAGICLGHTDDGLQIVQFCIPRLGCGSEIDPSQVTGTNVLASCMRATNENAVIGRF